MHKLLLFLFTAAMLPAATDPDGSRLNRLYSTFMAPCCWHENLSVHQSPAADELRAEIRKMAEEGVTDEQIKAQVVAQHTSRILAMPEGAKGQWLSWTPWVFTAVALTAVGWWLRRAAVRPKAVPAAAGPVAVVNEEDLEW